MFVGFLNLCLVLRCGSWCRFIIGRIAEENRAGNYILIVFMLSCVCLCAVSYLRLSWIGF